MFRSVKESLFGGWSADHYLVLKDFRDYVRVKSELNRDYGSEEFLAKCVRNTANGGKFSSDRSILDYAENVWKLWVRKFSKKSQKIVQIAQNCVSKLSIK